MSPALTGGCECGAIRYECSRRADHGRALPLSLLSQRERHRARLAPHRAQRGSDDHGFCQAL
jgi:hypothetical protein